MAANVENENTKEGTPPVDTCKKRKVDPKINNIKISTSYEKDTKKIKQPLNSNIKISGIKDIKKSLIDKDRLGTSENHCLH